MAPVVAALQTAEGPHARADLLSALGNAGLPEHVQTLIAATSARDPTERAVAIRALRKHRDEAAHAQVRAALDDPNVTVQRAGVRTLKDLGLEKTDGPALAAQVTNGTLHGAAFGAVLSLLGGGGLDAADARLVAQAIIESGRGPAQVRAAAERFIAGQ